MTRAICQPAWLPRHQIWRIPGRRRIRRTTGHSGPNCLLFYLVNLPNND